MRIAIVTHKVDFNDGQGRVNFEIAQAALARGHQVTVIAEFCSDAIAKHPRGRFICARDRHFPTQLLRNLAFANKSARWLKQHRGEFDLIQVNGFVTWEPADVVAVHFVHSGWLKNSSYPFRWSSLSPYAYYQRILTKLNSRWEKQTFGAAEALIAVSRFTAQEVIDLGLPESKVTVVYNGVDSSEFKPGPAKRAEFGLPEGVALALFVGDIRTPRKNLETVLKAMRSVKDLHLVVAGKVDGSPYPEMAKQLAIGDRVHFIGKTSRISVLMQSVDFFVFPSRYEAHPLVLMEAMASGLPVVVSGNFGAADYIRGGGKIFDDPEDAAQLGLLMAQLAASPDMRRSMGEAARQEAVNMSWTRTAEGYLQVYDELMRKRSLKSTAKQS